MYQYEGIGVVRFTQQAGRTVLSCSWESTAGGNVTVYEVPIVGVPHLLTTDPYDSPTDNYDVRILDAHGFDILLGLGADRDTTNTEAVFIHESSEGTVRRPTSGPHTIEIRNAGNAKHGLLTLIIEAT